MLDFFCDQAPWSEPLAEGAVVLRRRALAQAEMLMEQIQHIAAQNPFYHRITPGGHRMSVAMTHCGDAGWFSHTSGYHYSRQDQEQERQWPSIPVSFRHLASEAAHEAGFAQFTPDVCLINRYEPGARLTLHRDKDERDLRQPIVSVSLGLPALFLFGGFERQAAVKRILLEHGDVVIWGGQSRLRYHGILPVRPGIHPLVGALRYNLTFRKAL